MIIKSYEDLLVWKKAHQLVLDIYKATSEFPEEEKFGIISQMRRAAVSIPANICEGSQRVNSKELLYMLNVAKGSLAELEYYLKLTVDLGYLSESQYKDLKNSASEVGRMLNGLIKSIKARV